MADNELFAVYAVDPAALDSGGVTLAADELAYLLRNLRTGGLQAVRLRQPPGFVLSADVGDPDTQMNRRAVGGKGVFWVVGTPAPTHPAYTFDVYYGPFAPLVEAAPALQPLASIGPVELDDEPIEGRVAMAAAFGTTLHLAVGLSAPHPDGGLSTAVYRVTASGTVTTRTEQSRNFTFNTSGLGYSGTVSYHAIEELA